MRQMNLERRAEDHLARAQHLELQGRWEEALQELKRAIALDPAMAEGYAALGYHYRRKGLWAKAIDAFRTSVYLSESFESSFNLGHLLISLERHHEAVDIFERLIASEPADLATRYELARALYGCERYTEALEQVRPLLESFPGDCELLMFRASVYLSLADYEHAGADLSHALESASDDGTRDIVMARQEVVQRAQEFPSCGEFDLKRELYVQHGAVLLGSSGEDGIDIPICAGYPLTLQDVATILRRFESLCRTLSCPVTCIVPADGLALPPALVLSRLLDLPLCAFGHNMLDEFPLLVMGLCRGREMYNVFAEALAVEHVSFALGLVRSQQSEFVPDVVGVFVEPSSLLPWPSLLGWESWSSSADGGVLVNGHTKAARQASAIADDLDRQMASLSRSVTPSDDADYYGAKHRWLRSTLTCGLWDHPSVSGGVTARRPLD